MDDKRSIAYVRKLKGVADHRTVFGECAEVVGGLFEFDVCLSLCIGITDAHNQQHHIKNDFLHVLIFFIFQRRKGNPFSLK